MKISDIPMYVRPGHVRSDLGHAYRYYRWEAASRLFAVVGTVLPPVERGVDKGRVVIGTAMWKFEKVLARLFWYANALEERAHRSWREHLDADKIGDDRPWDAYQPLV